MGGVFGYNEVSQRAGIRSMDSNGKYKVMLSEPKLNEASALIEVDEIPNHRANKPFSPTLARNTANEKTYLNERKAHVETGIGIWFVRCSYRGSFGPRPEPASARRPAACRQSS